MRMVFTRDYSSVGSCFVHMQLLRLLNATWGPQLEYQEGKVFRVRHLVFMPGLKLWLRRSSATLHLLFLNHNRLDWPSSIKARRWPPLCCVHAHTRACCPGGFLWHAAGWWRWQAHIVPPLWLLLPVHAPIIIIIIISSSSSSGCSSLVEPDWFTAKSHPCSHAKTAPVSFNDTKDRWRLMQQIYFIWSELPSRI